MNLLEKCVVTEDFIKRSDVYNLCLGGEGGDTWKCVGRKHSEETKNFYPKKLKLLQNVLLFMNVDQMLLNYLMLDYKVI